MPHRSALLALAAVCLIGAGILGCPEAEAHGGRFRAPPPPPLMPPSMVPPTGRVPGAPPTTPRGPGGPITPRGPGPGTPTTPRPGGNRPITGNPSGPGGGITPGARPAGGVTGGGTPRATPTAPPVRGPTTGTGSRGPQAPLPGATASGPTIYRPRTRTNTGPRVNPDADWQTWWMLNRWAFLPTRESVVVRRLAVVTPSSNDGQDEAVEMPAPSPGAADDPIAAWDRKRATVARMMVPRLLHLLEPKQKSNPDVLAAALMALARTAQTPEALEVVLRYAEDPSQRIDVRESATLAVGLFRRTDPELQLDGLKLDLARRHLIALIDDTNCPTSARSMAALALGLLADQPYGSDATKDGKLVVGALWDRLNEPHADADLPVALLTAIGHQPRAGVSEDIRDGLKDIAIGRRVKGLKWSDLVRAHALGARLRLRGRGFDALLMRILTSTRVSLRIRRAAYLGMAQSAMALSADERRTVHKAWWKAIRSVRDPFTGGLAYIALGRLLAADRMNDPSSPLVAEAQGVPTLIDELGKARSSVRGYVALALGMALGAEGGDARAQKLRAKAERLLLRYLDKRKGDDEVHASYAIALGMLESQTAIPMLTRIVTDRTESPELRRHAAVALGQIGKSTAEIRTALGTAIRDDRVDGVSEDAALALALLGSSTEGRAPLDSIRKRGTHAAVGQIALALGRLGDLRAVGPLRQIAEDDSHIAENRALAVASLGLLLDPERPPSLARLQVDALYPVRTPTLHLVFDLL